MRITERFINPRFDALQDISFQLVNDEKGARIELNLEGPSPAIRPQDAHTLIAMLEALLKRAKA